MRRSSPIEHFPEKWAPISGLPEIGRRYCPSRLQPTWGVFRRKCGKGQEARAQRALAWRVVILAALGAVVGACSSDLSLNNVTLAPKPETLMRKPDWATYSGGKNDFDLRPITPADLVNAEGQCAGGAPGAPDQQPTGFTDSKTSGAPLPSTGGIALQMTECDVVRRAGQAEKVDFGINDRGERTVTLTYGRGPSAGIYRFAGGRLASIEGAPAPPQQAPAAKPKPAPKKPAGT